MSETGPREFTLYGMGKIAHITSVDALKIAHNIITGANDNAKRKNTWKYGLPVVDSNNIEEILSKIIITDSYTDQRVEFAQLYARLIGIYYYENKDPHIKEILVENEELYFNIIAFFHDIIETLNENPTNSANERYEKIYGNTFKMLRAHVDNGEMIRDNFFAHPDADDPNTTNKPNTPNGSKLIRSTGQSPKSTTPGITSVPKQMDLPKNIILETTDPDNYFDTFTVLETDDPKFVFVEIYGKMSKNTEQYRGILIANLKQYKYIVDFLQKILIAATKMLQHLAPQETIGKDNFGEIYKTAFNNSSEFSEDDVTEAAGRLSKVFGKLVDVIDESKIILKRLETNGIRGGKSKKRHTKKGLLKKNRTSRRKRRSHTYKNMK